MAKVIITVEGWPDGMVMVKVVPSSPLPETEPETGLEDFVIEPTEQELA